MINMFAGRMYIVHFFYNVIIAWIWSRAGGAWYLLKFGLIHVNRRVERDNFAKGTLDKECHKWNHLVCHLALIYEWEMYIIKTIVYVYQYYIIKYLSYAISVWHKEYQVI